MSGRADEEVNYKDRVEVKLYGPDGKLKEHRSSEKPGLLSLILALILMIPYLLIKTLFPSNK